MLDDSISPGTMKSEDEHRREICTAGRWIHGRAFVASTDGISPFVWIRAAS